MNSSQDTPEDAFMKNFIVVGLGVSITYINVIFVFAFFKRSVFYTDPRYILYIHLVINDIIMLFLTVSLYVLSYAIHFMNSTVCSFLLLFASTTSGNSPLNLAGMAIERYTAICKPLHHTQLCSVNRTYILTGLIWLLNVLPSLADIFILLVNEPICIFSKSIICYMKNVYGSNQHFIRSICVTALYSLCVWMTLVFTYVKVLQAANAATSDQVSARKAQKTILLHGLQLFLCLLTYVTPHIDYFFLILFPKYRTVFMYLNFILSNILPRLLSSLIYGVRNPNLFRYTSPVFAVAPVLHTLLMLEKGSVCRGKTDKVNSFYIDFNPSTIIYSH
ncbi:odorant receptor 131-2-like [Hoplias malabaricus]|uniref:odorant receptor 131-2-like n=1 Tax=Hoplias malabaricus TaxID=27720 RepID=UPI0034618CF4